MAGKRPCMLLEMPESLPKKTPHLLHARVKLLQLLAMQDNLRAQILDLQSDSPRPVGHGLS